MGRPGGRLVGRERETQLIATALRLVPQGRPATVVVQGEPGIGKPALVDDVAVTAVAKGFGVVRAFCAPIGATVLPYGPILGLVADLRCQAPEVLGALSPQVQRGLRRR